MGTTPLRVSTLVAKATEPLNERLPGAIVGVSKERKEATTDVVRACLYPAAPDAGSDGPAVPYAIAVRSIPTKTERLLAGLRHDAGVGVRDRGALGGASCLQPVLGGLDQV